MTYIALTALTAAQLNTFVRDNLNETAPGKATTAGSLFVSTGVNTIAERRMSSATVSVSESTTNQAFTDLTTLGPAVSLSTGTRALVVLGAEIKAVSHFITPVGGAVAAMSFAVSGASTISASAERQVRECQGSSGGDAFMRRSMFFFVSDLTAGTNVFTMKYALLKGDVEGNGANALFNERHMIVIAL